MCARHAPLATTSPRHSRRDDAAAMTPEEIKRIVEAALLAAGRALSVDQLVGLFDEHELSENPRQAIRDALTALEDETQERGFEVVRVASGYRLQVRQEFGQRVNRLFEERPPRYSRALLETLALIAYRQPVTRGDIEDVRGVTVAPSIMRTLLERGWIRTVGQRETPGRPTMYGTTRAFLDYFNLRSLDELPPLAEIKALIEPVLTDELADADEAAEADGDEQPGVATALEESPDAPETEDERPLAEVVQLPLASVTPDQPPPSKPVPASKPVPSQPELDSND